MAKIPTKLTKGNLSKLMPFINNYMTRGAALGIGAQQLVKYIGKVVGPQGQRLAQRQADLAKSRSGRARPDELALAAKEQQRERDVDVTSNIVGSAVGIASALGGGGASALMGAGGAAAALPDDQQDSMMEVEDTQEQVAIAGQPESLFDMALEDIGVTSIPPELSNQARTYKFTLDSLQAKGVTYDDPRVQQLVERMRKLLGENAPIAAGLARVREQQRGAGTQMQSPANSVDAQLMALLQDYAGG